MKNADTSRRRRSAIIAGIAGAALLLGGQTYALWSDSASLAGGTVTAGTLDIAAGTFAAYDVSADRTDTGAITSNNVELSGLAGHAVTLSTWRMVPGDTVALAFPYTITLEGDNLVAQLKLNASTLTANAFSGASAFTQNSTKTSGDNLTFRYSFFDGDGTALVDHAELPASDTDPVAYFQADGAGQDAGLADGTIPMVSTTDHTASVTFVLFATFNSATADQGQEDINAVANLAGSLTATLTQVRANDPANGGNFATPTAPAQP